MTSIPDFSQADFHYPYGGGTSGLGDSPFSNSSTNTGQQQNNQYASDDGSSGGGFGAFALDSSTGNMFNAGAFQQPFVPHDLWSAPMTFEWDWADLANMPG